MKLHGLDWLAMVLSLLALMLLGKRNRFGFISFMVANVSWIAAGILLNNLAICIGNLAFLIYNLRGFTVWSREAAGSSVKTQKALPMLEPNTLRAAGATCSRV